MEREELLPAGAPEAHGVPSAAILAFVDAVEQQQLELHSMMLLRNGHVLAQGWWTPYRPDDAHMMFSVSKSFTSTAVGLAVAEGRLTVDDAVLGFFPDEAPADPGPNLKAMRVRHLLSMSTGHAEDTLSAMWEAEDANWARGVLRRPVDFAPGSHFVYNSGASYLLSAIVQQVTGMTLLDYLGPRLFEPLGIRGATWESCPRGINTGGWGLSIKTADLARFGQLLLQQGEWQGRQLVPRAWIAEATAAQVSNGSDPESDWQQGYGYQFWRSRHGAYRGDGAFGQFCLVMPEQEAVLITTAGLQDMQAVLNLVWQHLLPAMGAAPLAQDRAAGAALERRLAGLALPVLGGANGSSAASRVSGRRFVFDPNEQQARAVRFDFAGDRCTLTFDNQHGTHSFVCGDGAWVEGSTSYDDGVSRPAAATGAWTDRQTFEARLRYTEAPFGFTLTCRFDADRVTLEQRDNVAFGPTEHPRLEGREG